MEGQSTSSEVLHICADYAYNKLYDLLISQLTEKYPNIVYVPSPKRATDANYPVHYLERDFGIIERFLFFGKQRAIVNDIEGRGLCSNASIIHAHTLFTAGCAARRLSKKYHIPYIVAVRNADVNFFYHYMLHVRTAGINVLKDAKYVIFISPVYKEHVLERMVPPKYRDIIEAKSIVIPNGINNFFLNSTPLTCQNKMQGKRIRLVYVGEVNKNKNITTTLKACELLEEKGYLPSLTIVGRISDTSFSNIGCQKYVDYHQQCPKEDVIKFLRGNDIFVMPSINETFGLSYVEALSQGLPIIYSKGQGIDGYFDEGSVGYHVDKKNAQDIAISVERILQDYPNMSSRCIEAAKPFSWSRIAGEYLQLYENVMKD